MLKQLWVKQPARSWRYLFFCLSLLLLVSGPVWSADNVNKLTAVAVDQGAAMPTVLIKTAEPVGYRYTVYDSFDPTRVVIDFPGMEIADIAEQVAVNLGSVQDIRLSGFDLSSGQLTRVEVLLAETTEYQVNLVGKEFRIAFATEVSAAGSKKAMAAKADKPVAPVDASADARVLRNVKLSPGKAILEANGKVSKFQHFSLANPPRLVVDLYGVSPAFKERSFPAEDGFKKIRIGTYNDKTRLVFDASSKTLPEHLVEGHETDILVTWGHVKPATASKKPATASKKPATASKKPAAVAKKPAVVAEKKAVVAKQPIKVSAPVNVESLDFNNSDGRSIIAVALSAETNVLGPVAEGNLVRFEIVNAKISRSLRRTIDASAFPSAVTSVTPYTVTEGDHQNVRIAVDLKGPVDYALERDGQAVRLVVEDGAYVEPVPPAVSKVDVVAPEVIDEVAAQVETSEAVTFPAEGQKEFKGERVSLDFINANVRMLLRLIADVSNLNIIASDSVGGTMTLRLQNVPWEQALDLILTTNGLKMNLVGNIAHIMTVEEYNTLKQQELDAKVKSFESQQRLRVREVVKIQHVNMETIDALSDLYGEGVTITTDKATKSAVLVGNEVDVEQLKETIREIDIPEKQVMIEARIVEASTEANLDFGVKWGASYADDGIDDNTDLESANLGLGGEFAIAPPVGGVMSSDGGALGLTFGNLAVTGASLDVRLSALEGNGDVKVVSTPKIATLNGNAATITQGRQIPYTTTSADGLAQTSFVDAILSLTVTPEINPNGSIIMDVDITNDSQGPNVASGDGISPSIEKKTAQTKLLVQDGQTTVIGGIFVDSEDVSNSGVPVLKDIPGVGHLFKSTSKKASRRELLIFITPRIVQAFE